MKGILTWPNLLSLLRLPLAVAFPLAQSTASRAAIVAAAALSDFIDGKLARRYASRSRAGEVLDPITDKVFTLTALATYVAEGKLAFWQLLVLLARDIYNAAAFFIVLLLRLPLRFESRWSGKVTTSIQLAALLVLLFVPAATGPLVVLAGVAGLYAIVDYTLAGLRSLRRSAGAP